MVLLTTRFERKASDSCKRERQVGLRHDNLDNKKNDYKSSKRDKSKENKSDVIYNKKTSKKSKDC